MIPLYFPVPPAGAVRESCGFVKGDKGSSSEDYLEFQWADYLRTHWAQTGIPIKDIDTDFDNAIDAALHLAAQKDAEPPGVYRKDFMQLRKSSLRAVHSEQSVPFLELLNHGDVRLGGKRTF